MQKPLFVHYRKIIENFIKSFIENNDDISSISVDPPKDKTFGDFSTNIAMVLAKRLKRNPIELAEEIAAKMRNHQDFVDVTVKKPGFINWNVPQTLLKEQIREISDKNYGKCDLGKGIKVNIEYGMRDTLVALFQATFSQIYCLLSDIM